MIRSRPFLVLIFGFKFIGIKYQAQQLTEADSEPRASQWQGQAGH